VIDISAEPRPAQKTAQPKSAGVKQIKTIRPSKHTHQDGISELMFDVAGVGSSDFRQRTVWRYRLKVNDDYVFELTRYDKFAMAKPGAAQSRIPIETQWDASIYHTSWDSVFGENDLLRPGTTAKWDPALETFFPTDAGDFEQRHSSGLHKLTDAVRGITKCMNEAMPYA